MTEIRGHPGHGARRPTLGTPPRRPGSIRRTTTVDIVRPGGFTHGLRLLGRGRDLRTGPDGAGAVLDEGQFSADVDYPDGRLVRALRVQPALDLSALLDRPAMRGFRSALAGHVPVGQHGSVLYQLLDDIPVATLIAGQAQISDELEPGVPQLPMIVPPGVCSGWRADGTMVTGLRRGIRPRVQGPAAPALRRPDDPDAWHPLPPGEPTMMRRHRRLDVHRDGPVWRVDSFLRDSHWLGSGPHRGTETIVHEYAVQAAIRVDGHVLEHIETNAHVLPWQECVLAAASPESLVGSSVDHWDERVRAEFVGTGYCTHLNDVLRTLIRVPLISAAYRP
jgi:hypothetical protein